VSASPHNPKGWTFASFEVYVDHAIKSLKEATAIAMTASEKAIEKAEKSDDKRFSLLNEFRATTNDQQANFAQKDQTQFRLDAIDKELVSIKLSLQESRGKDRGVWLIVGAIAWAVTTGVAVFAVIHR
jgi:hypothetical protein